MPLYGSKRLSLGDIANAMKGDAANEREFKKVNRELDNQFSRYATDPFLSSNEASIIDTSTFNANPDLDREVVEGLLAKRQSLLDIPRPEPSDDEMRFALDRMVEEGKEETLDALVAHAKDEVRMASLIDDAFEHMEQKRQIDILKEIHGGEKELKAFMTKSNPSRTTEQQISRGLLYDGVLPDVIPPDRILGKDVTTPELGIDGMFKPDSEIRRHVRGGMKGDNLELNRTNVKTEILSPRGIEEAYEAWKPNAFGNASRSQFNMAAQEYYGQQALKILGHTPVSDENRSFLVQKAARKGNPAATTGTNRLVENSVGVSDKDVAQSADFRSMNPQGQLAVTDYQVGQFNPNDPLSVNLSLLKTSNLGRGDIAGLEGDMVRVAQKLEAAGVNPELDMIFNELQKEGKLADTVMRTRDKGTRPGKFMSNAPIMGDVNFDDQHRMDGVLYGMVDGAKHSSQYGMLPDHFRYFSADNVRNHIGNMYAKGVVNGNLFTKNSTGQPGNLYFNSPVEGRASGALTDSLNRQFSEEYTF